MTTGEVHPVREAAHGLLVALWRHRDSDDQYTVFSPAVEAMIARLDAALFATPEEEGHRE